MVRSTIPILQAMERLKEIEKDIKRMILKEHRNATWVDKYVKDVTAKVLSVSPHLHKSLILQNCAFSEGLKKRKGDICNTLGNEFAAYKGSKSTEEWLFDEDAVKKMKSSLKAVSEKRKYHSSKNSSSSHKSHRSSFQKGSNNNNSKYRKSYQNNNYNNNKNQNQNKNGGSSGYNKRKGSSG